MDVFKKARVPAANLAGVEEGRLFIQSTLERLLAHKSHIHIGIEAGEYTTVYRVSCHPDDLGKLIGKKGKTVGGLRTLLIAIVAKYGLRVVVEIPFLPKKKDDFGDFED
ncbi:KH domain-containing protein [Bdellovibrio sp. 22V]|uniref:KH domain-containing protein n=1 Tax=Bdellovibrio sp. 22V TaxID=3044166 RepID=UPI00254275FA|nr:KH domain-containing protein [Bdellovibrio sp. 22V]WII71702.1 KH domain-containing protein [Bdellovibrio sp. 22V]